MSAYRYVRRVALAFVMAAAVALGALTTAGPAQASSLGDAAVAEAATHLGAPYQWGGAGPNSFDCSGLVMAVYATLGIQLPHYTVSQYAVSQHVPKDQKQPGDVIFIYDSTGYIYHDGIYAGNNTMIVATHTGSTVQRQTIWTTSYWVGRY